MVETPPPPKYSEHLLTMSKDKPLLKTKGKIENKEKINTPIILLTAKGEADERIKGLETGADDYLPKPFEPKELLLRINNILNKTSKENQKRLDEYGF